MSEQTVKPAQARPSKKHTADVVAGFKRDGNQWRTSAGIADYITATNQTRYTLVSALKYYEILDRRDALPGETGEYRYRLSAKALAADPIPVPPKSSKHVHWTVAERQLIKDEVTALRAKTPTPMVDAANIAVRKLIERGLLATDRKRTLRTMVEVQWLFTTKVAKAPPTPTAAPVLASPAVPPSAHAPKHIPPDPTPPPPAKPTVSALSFPTSTLIEALLTRAQQGATKVLTDAIDYGLTRAFKNIVDSQQGQALLKGLRSAPVADAPAKHDPVHPSPERERLTRILVAGIRPGEVAELNSEFNKLFDLRYWFEGDSSHLLKDRCKNVDSAVVLVKRLGHSDADLVKNSGVPYKFAVGNNPALAAKETLTDMYVQSH